MESTHIIREVAADENLLEVEPRRNMDRYSYENMKFGLDTEYMECDPSPSSSNIGEQILEWTMDMQGLWDEFKAPIELQDKMIKMLFSGIQPSKGRKAISAGDKKSLATLLLSSTQEEIQQRIPQNLDQVFCQYRSLGMVEPQRWRLCVGHAMKSHLPKVFCPNEEESRGSDILRCMCYPPSTSSGLKGDWAVCCIRCEECGNSRKQMIPFDYISFREQLKLLCKSNTNCHQFLAMWRGKDGWLGHISSEQHGNVKEFWDGYKVRLYQDFWNPHAYWEIPVICQNQKCKKIYRTFPCSMRSEELSHGWNEEQQKYYFRCSKCKSWTQSKRQLVKGDPRNFALIGHWDGFQAASTKQKDVGIVEMSIANANKGSEIGPIPLLFIPFSLVQMEEKHGDLLQHFLTPLVDELVSAFNDGFEVEYNYPLSLIANDLSNEVGYNCTLRAILMLWTGDHPAQCKLGMFKDGGKNGCRRDCPLTTKIIHERRIPFYVYSGNRYQARYPPPKRQIEDMHAAIKASKRDSTKKAREETLSKAGLTGESCLWRLYDLYGFDISKDLVYDVMHVFALNIFKKYTKSLFEGSSNNQKKLIDIATREVTLAVPKSERHQGRWPSTTPSKSYTMFVAEEHQKFVMWCLPHVLNTVVDIKEELKTIGILVVDIAHIFYNFTRTHGWTKEDMEVTRSLLSSWRILTEDIQGASSSPLEHVAGNAEVLDDVLRHGGHDGMWCYRNERAVSGFVSIPTNNKTNEVTYAKYQSRVMFTKTKQKMKMEEDGLLPGERLLSSLHACLQKPEGMILDKAVNVSCEEWHSRSILVTTSEKLALEKFKVIELIDSCPCKELLNFKGILVSPLRKRVRSMTDFERQTLQSFWRDGQLSIDEVRSYAKVFLRAERYHAGDLVIVNSMDNKTLCELEGIFSHEHCGNIEIFFDGSFFNGGISISGLPRDEVTGMNVLSSLQLTNRCRRVFPITCIMHKCFLLPARRESDNRVVYEMRDNGIRNRLVNPGYPGCIPPWLEIGDVVLINLDGGSTRLQHGVVRHVCHESRKVMLGVLCMVARDEWEVEIEDEAWRDWSVCLKLLPGWMPIRTVTFLDSNGELQQQGIRFKCMIV